MAVPEAVLKWRTLCAGAVTFGIEPDLALSVLWQECGGDQWAMRYEVAWRYFYDAKRKLPLYERDRSIEVNRTGAFRTLGATEFHAQSTSFGLFQVMGAVARERGLRGWLTRLCDPETGMQIGLTHLSKKIAQGKGDIREGLKLYNGVYSYADEVLAKIKEVKGV